MLGGLAAVWWGGGGVVARRLVRERDGENHRTWIMRGPLIFAPAWMTVPIFFVGIAALVVVTTDVVDGP
jgi:hypothetical protein